MQTFPLSLALEQLWRAPSAARLQIHCERGLLWVTVRGEAQDHLLRAGEVLVLERPRDVLIGAVERAQAVVAVEDTAAGLLCRLASWAWARPVGLLRVGGAAKAVRLGCEEPLR